MGMDDTPQARRQPHAPPPMRKITRCPGCATRFKVVPDQLRISHGWVRCGVCGAVFDASKHLMVPSRRLAAAGGGAAQQPAPEQDGANPGDTAAVRQVPADAPAPAAAAQSAPPAQQAAQEATVPPPDTLPLDAPRFDASGHGSPLPDSGGDWDLSLTQPQPTLPPPPAAQALAAREPAAAPRGLDADDSPPPDADAVELALDAPPAVPAHAPRRDPLLDDEPLQPAPATRKPQPKHPTAKTARMRRQRARRAASEAFGATEPSFSWPQSVLPPEEIEQLSFVRRAGRQQFWRRPAVRAALLAACLLAGGLLALQIAHTRRDTLAAHHPALAPALRALCRMSGCTLQARRAIGDIVISNSVFWRVPDSGQYQWDLSLENRSGAAVAMPALELTLTDLRGTPLLRRVVLPEEIQAPPLLAARDTWSMTAPVAVQELGGQIASYRAQVFYP